MHSGVAAALTEVFLHSRWAKRFPCLVTSLRLIYDGEEEQNDLLCCDLFLFSPLDRYFLCLALKESDRYRRMIWTDVFSVN
ncbi:hypothetical protein COCNU_scaffold035165G000010 [Cocos nucifera]|nr:hypothetical protein [Cocos nucifera]